MHPFFRSSTWWPVLKPASGFNFADSANSQNPVVRAGPTKKPGSLGRAGLRANAATALRSVGPDPRFPIKINLLVRNRLNATRELVLELGVKTAVHRSAKKAGARKKPGVVARPGCDISSGRNSASGAFPDRAGPALAPIPAGIHEAKSFGVLNALHRGKRVVGWGFDAAELAGQNRLCQLFDEKFFGKNTAFPGYTTCKFFAETRRVSATHAAVRCSWFVFRPPFPFFVKVFPEKIHRMAASPQTTATDTTTDKPRLSFWQIWNMSFGFLGIQYGFGLQQANMSPIFRYLNADEASIPALWLAGPVTGLLVQPLIGAMSDRTWSPRWGRRKPYFLVGALITSLALILMPNSSALWMAASLMWLLDAGLNVTMEPFRAFIGDKLNVQQRTLGFAVQSFFVGFGQTLANLMPRILPLFGVTMVAAGTNGIPDFVKYSFYIGAVAILVAVLWTVYTTDEYPPDDLAEFERQKRESGGVLNAFTEVAHALREMPATMKQLWWVKFFTWYGLPLMWQYLSLAIARHAFDAPTAESPGFSKGIEVGNDCFALFNVGCFGISFLLPSIANRIGRRATHAVFLSIGGLGFLSMLLGEDANVFRVGMTLVGLAWGSIMSMPYVMLSTSVPKERMGVYMGIFNGFIVVPQIVNMITIPFLYDSILNSDPRNALILGGICLFLAAGACFLVKENVRSQKAAFPTGEGGN